MIHCRYPVAALPEKGGKEQADPQPDARCEHRDRDGELAGFLVLAREKRREP